MAWWNRNQGIESNRPRGIDTPMNYQDQIRTLPGGNYQNWQDRIMDPDLMVNQEYEDSLQDINTNPRWDDEGTGQREISYKDDPIPLSGFFTGKRRLHPNNPLLKLTQGLGSIFQPNETMEAAIGDIRETGEFAGQRYNIDEDRNKIYSEVNPFGKNLRSKWGSDDPTAQDDKTLAWAMDRLARGKAISQRLRNILQNRGMLTPTGTDRIGGDTSIPIGPIETGGTTGRTTGGPDMSIRGWDPGLAAAMGSYNREAGPMGGEGYGPWMAEGGRAGYQGGELVDEDINIRGPGYDVNENIEMASAVDPMDALNDMAMQIFGKPLHELTPEEKQILFDMANDQAAMGQGQGQGQGEGIASLV